MSLPVLTALEIAQVCHEVNKAYCESLGDTTQVDWEHAPDWQKLSLVDGVLFHQYNPEAGPDASHNNWMAKKEAEGWSYGKVKSTSSKKHPCMVPYDKLPDEQKSKDFIFRQVVRSLSNITG